MNRVHRGLTRVLNDKRTARIALHLEDHTPVVVISDLHAGNGDGADEYRHCDQTLYSALSYYYGVGYDLIVAGDCLELWEQSDPSRICLQYPMLFVWLKRFASEGRLSVLVGNHDEQLGRKGWRAKYAASLFGDAPIRDGVVLHVKDDGQELGRVMVTHGHQGELFSDQGRWLSRLLLPLYRWLQRHTGYDPSPSKSPTLRGKQEQAMHAWAVAQSRLVLVCGHTHRALWKLPYVNTGCCRNRDGSITAVEISDGAMRLVRWSGSGSRLAMFSSPLASAFGVWR